MKKIADQLVTRALRTRQGMGVDVYAFFLRGGDVTRVADISRISRDEADVLKGFQRREIRTHVQAIADFLDSGPVLFPNAIILALAPEVEFKLSRGPVPAGATETTQSGTLAIPLRPEGARAAWIVDGQQRSLALALWLGLSEYLAEKITGSPPSAGTHSPLSSPMVQSPCETAWATPLSLAFSRNVVPVSSTSMKLGMSANVRRSNPRG